MNMLDTRSAQQEKLQAHLEELAADIAKLKALAHEAKADAKIDMEREIADLESRHGDVKQQLEELRQAGEGAWEDVKQGVEKARDNLADAVRQARRRFDAPRY
jgi:archaellum component FlaC